MFKCAGLKDKIFMDIETYSRANSPSEAESLKWDSEDYTKNLKNGLWKRQTLPSSESGRPKSKKHQSLSSSDSEWVGL
jgi:hypothetical protein